jgi:hypothetical protein
MTPFTFLPAPRTVLPSVEGLLALEAQRQRVRRVKAQVNEIKGDRAFMRAAKALNKQARFSVCFGRRSGAERSDGAVGG